MLGPSGGVEGVRVALEAGRECRGSGASRGIGGIRGQWGLLGCRSVRGALGWHMDWEPDHIGPQSRVLALLLVPPGESPTSPRPGKGPSPGSHHSHWFPLGSELPGQGQASDRNELCRLLYILGTIFSDSLHICIYAAYSHILTCNVEKCYMDYVLSRPIYAYPYTINLMY